MNFRVGIGHDTHRLIEGRPLILGGVTIPYEKGLDGHSDADVVLHALTDAILGAVGAGDIGDLYPDNDPAHQNRDSAFFLKDALARFLPPPGNLVNIDCIIFAEKPKLGPHKTTIRERLAKLVGLPVSRVNVKAKTGERVGPIGRGEALSAEVVVLVDLGEVRE